MKRLFYNCLVHFIHWKTCYWFKKFNFGNLIFLHVCEKRGKMGRFLYMYICNVYSFATMSNLHVHECQACLVCLIKCKVSLKADMRLRWKVKKFTRVPYIISKHIKNQRLKIWSLYFILIDTITFTHFLLKLNL